MICDVHADARFDGLLGAFSGSLRKSGSGTVSLTAANVYTGNTKVSAGTLALTGVNGALLSSAVYIDGGRLLLDNMVDNHPHRIQSSAGVTLRGGELALQGNSAGTSETIDSLFLDSGHSTLTVVAANNVSILTAPELIRNPGTTALVRGTSLGSGSSGAIAQIQFTSAPPLSNSGSGDQIGIVPYLIGDNDINGQGTDLVTYGNNGLRLLASDEYVSSFLADKNVKLTSDPTPTDTISINSLVLDSGGAPLQVAVNSSSTLTITSGAILSTGSSANTLSGGTITFGNNSATGYEGIVHTLADLTIQNAIANNGNNVVGLTKSGAGTLSLTGVNTYNGGTVISAGTLQIGNGGTRGSIAGGIINNAQLVFNRSRKLTFTGAISGSGSLTKLGTSTLILSGNNSYTGGTIINAGTLQFGNGGGYGLAAGPILNNASLVFNLAGSRNFRDTITGSGSVTKLGGDDFIIYSDNTYTGGTIISSGMLRIGDGGTSGSIVGDVLNNSTLQFYRADDITFSGAISGSGRLIKYGPAILTLTGANTCSGNTFIYDGTLKLAEGGSLASNLIDINTGIFDVSGISAYTLGVGQTIEGKGAIAGAVTVLGTVAPGESAGSLTVDDMTFGNGSVLDIELGGTTPGKLYDVLNSTGISHF